MAQIQWFFIFYSRPSAFDQALEGILARLHQLHVVLGTCAANELILVDFGDFSKVKFGNIESIQWHDFICYTISQLYQYWNNTLACGRS